MKRTQQEWDNLQKEVHKLKKENQQLKRLLKLQVKQYEPEKMYQRDFYSFKQSQNHAHKDQNQNNQLTNSRNLDQLKKQWAQWSNRLQASIVSKNNRFRHNTQMQELRKTSNLSGGSLGSQGFYPRKSLQSVKSKNSEEFINLQLKSPGKSQQIIDPSLQLIQDIFLFGPSITDIENAQQRKFYANHQLYYPECQKQNFQVYGTYLFPNQLEIKHIRQKNHGVQVNKMIFKNNKKLDSQQNNEKLKKPNKILQKVNPSKYLYALSIQFSDFVSVKNEKIALSKLNKTFSLLSDGADKSDRYIEGDMLTSKQQFGGTASKKIIESEQSIFKSNFCLCIMTYFPFIRFLKDILIEVFDSVKLRRMNKYNKCSAYKQTDIYFFIEQLKVELAKFLNDKLKLEPEINKMYEFSLNGVAMKLDLKQNNLINQIVGDWGFKILKILDKQSLLDIFCYIMMEESICFLSQDRSILTFVILLYVVVFSLPFGYAHPCISVVFNEQLLQTPFTAVLGINKGTKWLEQNLEHLTQNKQNKIIVNLNQQEVKIKFKKKPRTHKSQRLKKIFTNFYKRIQTSAIPSIFKKKIQLISRETTKQENQGVSQLFNQLAQYYQEQLMNHLPNPQIIDLIKESLKINEAQLCSQHNPTVIYNIVIQKIEKYLGQSRKSKNKDTKDQFIDQLIKKQLFRVYIDRLYGME